MRLTENDGQFVNLLTIVFNLSSIFSLLIAPICGYMIEYRAYRGENYRRRSAILIGLFRFHAETIQSVSLTNLHLASLDRSLSAIDVSIIYHRTGGHDCLDSLSNDARLIVPGRHCHAVNSLESVSFPADEKCFF